MTFLLDVNVLIALIDPAHASHDVAHAWFEREGARDWATCPITENGVIRIVGHARYPNSPGPPAAVADLFREMRRLSGHVFWPDAISLLDPQRCDVARISSAQQVTDCYLLALAASRGGRLATFDRRLSTQAVAEGRKALRLIS